MDTSSEYAGPRSELLWSFRLAEDSESALASYLERGTVWVARDDGRRRCVGHLQVVVDGDAWEVLNTAVAEDAAGRGDRPAAASSTSWPRPGPAGVRRLVVATAAADVGNLRFYQRCGFRMERVVRRRLHAGDRLPGPDRDRRDPAARPGLVRDGAVNDRELHERGLSTAFAAWEEYAAGSAGAEVRHEPGCTVAVFPSDPEAEFLNNAVLDRGLSSPALAAAPRAGRGPLRGHRRPTPSGSPTTTCEARAFLEARGYVLDTTTAAMAIELAGPVGRGTLRRRSDQLGGVRRARGRPAGRRGSARVHGGDRPARRRPGRGRHRLRARGRPRHLQRRHARACAPPWAGRPRSRGH